MKKKPAIRVMTFLSAAVIVLGVLAVSSMRRARSLELYARANTQHAFDELVTSVSELSNALEKSVYITDPVLESALCTQMFGRAVTAQMAMGILPYSSQELEQTAGFLSKVGDYACVLSRTVGGNGGYSEEELSNLTALAETAGVMAMNLRDMQDRIMSGALTMDEVYAETDAARTGDGGAPLAGTVFESIETEFPELPTLIYDGPFSESMESPVPRFLDALPEVDEAAARTAAAAFLAVDENAVTFLGDCGGTIPCRCYSACLSGGEYFISVTNQGGRILSALCSRIPGAARFSVDTGRSIARAFVAQQGYDGLTESYHMVDDGVLTVNFEHSQEGVICYPDLVKVGVALDNGAIVSFDAKGYLSSHYDRELPDVAVSAEDACATVPASLSIRSRGMAVIPSGGGEERLCHELVCQAEDGRRYIIYVNAQSGAQEKILILLEDEAGTLTI